MSITSDWGDWLLAEIEAASPNGLAVWYLGCNGFVCKSSSDTTLFVDPYLGLGDPPRTVRMIPVPFDPADVTEADAILATHEHTDHVHGPSQAPILAATGAAFYGPGASVRKTREAGWRDAWAIEPDQLNRLDAGETRRIGDLTVHVEPANDPDADDPVSYVIEHQTGTFFHGGDARPGGFDDAGNRYDIDLGVLAFGSPGMIRDKETRRPKRTKWYNDEEMIVEAANELKVERLLPSHWDMWRGLNADPTALHAHTASFEYPRKLDIVRIGDRVDV